MKLVFFIKFGLLILLKAFSQSPYPTDQEVLLAGEIYIPPVNLTGKQYLHETWQMGSIYTRQGKYYPNQLINYNMLMDQLFWLSSNSYQQVMIDRGFISGFSIINNDSSVDHFEIIIIKDPITGIERDIFAQRLYKGDWGFYVSRTARLLSRSETVNISGRPVQQRIIQSSKRYYFSDSSGNFSPVTINRRSFLNLFPENKNQIRSLLRQHNLSIKSEDQFVKALHLLESNIF